MLLDALIFVIAERAVAAAVITAEWSSRKPAENIHIPDPPGQIANHLNAPGVLSVIHHGALARFGGIPRWHPAAECRRISDVGRVVAGLGILNKTMTMCYFGMPCLFFNRKQKFLPGQVGKTLRYCRVIEIYTNHKIRRSIAAKHRAPRQRPWQYRLSHKSLNPRERKYPPDRLAPEANRHTVFHQYRAW